MEVYIVHLGWYDDRQIKGVFSSEEAAKAYIREFQNDEEARLYPSMCSMDTETWEVQ